MNPMHDSEVQGPSLPNPSSSGIESAANPRLLSHGDPLNMPENDRIEFFDMLGFRECHDRSIPAACSQGFDL